MSNMFLNSQADEYLMGLRFSGSESKEYEEAHLKWDNPVDYSIFLEKDSNYFKLLKDTEVIDSNYIYNGSSIWAKGITNINIIKLGNPLNKILDSPGYGDEFIGDSLTEERYKEANQYFTTKVKDIMSLLEESNFKDIKSVNMYKGTTFIKEGEDILEYSFIVPIAFISFYYRNRVLSCFLYKNGLIFIIEYGYGKNGENSIDTENLIKILSEKLKVIFYNEQVNNS